MKVLQEPNTWVIEKYSKVIESFGNDPSKLRMHKYIINVQGETGAMLYNCITKEVVLLDECDNLFSEHFVKNLWLVPNDFADAEFVIDLKQELFRRRPSTIAPRSYTIVTTTGCNARCFYCYEMGIAKNNMTEQTAADVSEYIVNNFNNCAPEKRKEVRLSWFGGEPLFNSAAIDSICNNLSLNCIPFKSTMISNGYYFDEEMVKKAKDLWLLQGVQITLDGTEEKYNRAKNYINKEKNPFKIVTDNIERLALNGIHVSIRINVGYYNCDDIMNLAKFIKERYNGIKNISVYLHALFDHGGVTDIDTEEKEKTVFETMQKIEDFLSSAEIYGESAVNNRVRGEHCMSDNGVHVVIQTDGKLCLCEHYVNSMQIGSIYENSYDQEVVEKFKEISEPFNECYDCPLFPECSSLVICEDTEDKCGKYRQAYKINKKIRGLLLLEKIKLKKRKKV